ncbi:MAG: Nif3-like dinuclear metal center hexameric protein [Balneolales bacterium]
MMTTTAGHISTFFEKWAPERTKLDYDNVGLLIGSKHKTVSKILTCLDITEAIVEEAVSGNFDLIVAHHPVIFKKVSRINPDSIQGKIIYKLISGDIAVLAVHTNLDAAENGVSFVLANQIGLKNTAFLTRQQDDETPTGFGVIGEFENSLPQAEFLETVKNQLNCEAIRYTGSRSSVQKIAVCGGSGSSLASKAMDSGADAYITADVKYHDFFTEKADFLLLDVGHYESESPIINIMRDALKSEFTELNVESTRINTNPIQTYK